MALKFNSSESIDDDGECMEEMKRPLWSLNKALKADVEDPIAGI